MKFYITTAIAYVNAAPHIGHALEFVQADVLARFNRLLGREVWFLTGTDEYGSKIFKTANESGRSVEEVVEENVAKFKNLRGLLNLSYDDFIRTSDRKRHWPAVQKFWQKLTEARDIYKSKYKGYYCEGCEAYLSEKEMVDQCCVIHKKPVQALEEENYFFRLSKYGPKIRELIENGEFQIIPEKRKNEILSFIEAGLQDVSFSRPHSVLPWGIPVPGDESQVIYVWCDALINYISALGYATEDKKFKTFWPADVQVIGKDILRFHAAIWPAMLISVNLPLPKILFAHGFITNEGEKISKSLGNVVINPGELVKKYGTDALRYYLLREIPPADDGDFSEARFKERYNADLANGLGNLTARVLKLVENYKSNFKVGPASFQEEIDKVWQNYKNSLADFKFHEACGEIFRLVKLCDEYIDREKPWQLAKEQNQNLEKVLSNLLIALANIAWLLLPFLPETSQKIFKQLGIKPDNKRGWKEFKIKKLEALFPRLK